MSRFAGGYDVMPNHKYLLIFRKIFLPLASVSKHFKNS